MSVKGNRVIGGGNSPVISNTCVKQRNSNLELYRIIVMLLIIAHHYVVNSGINPLIRESFASGNGFINAIFFALFGAWGKTGINCFVLISGYFYCVTDITLKKFLKLALEVVFYNILIYIIFCASGYSLFSAKELFLAFLPIRNCSADFTSAFLLFYLSVPFLNLLLKQLTKQMHLLLLGLLLFVYTVMPMMKADVSYNYLSWFSVLYWIASYIKLYGLPHNESASFWGWCTIISLSLSAISILSPLAFHGGYTYFFVSDSNHIMAILSAVTSFMYFKNLKIGYNKLINNIASTTFGVFLIHTNSNTMLSFLWKDLLDAPGHYDSPLYAVIVVLLLFGILSIIDFTRLKTIERPIVNAIEKGCNIIYNKLYKK